MYFVVFALHIIGERNGTVPMFIFILFYFLKSIGLFFLMKKTNRPRFNLRKTVTPNAFFVQRESGS